jgi:hypothetical protein
MKPLAVAVVIVVVEVILAVGHADATPWDTIVIGSQSEAQRLANIPWTY